MDNITLQNASYKDRQALERALTPKLNKYIPTSPHPKQAAFLLLDCREAMYGGAAGGGKATLISESVLTKNGWKTIGTLQLTDKVVALDGSWSEIEYITPEMLPKQAYEITFSNGETITCDAEHLWLVERKRQINKNHRHKIVAEPQVMTTQQIIDDGLLYKANNKIQKRYMLPQHYGFDGTYKELPINPYTLGLWLGDGTSNRGEIAIGHEDAAHLLDQLTQRGEEFSSFHDNSRGQCLSARIEELTTKLIKNSLINNKHIPLEYKLANREQRVELLKGLMDSDGYCQARGRCEWGQQISKQELFDDVCEIITGLGYSCSKTVAPSRCNGKSFPSNRVTFTPREYVATIPRKVENMFNDNVKDTNTATYIESIKPVDSGPMKCIRIKNPTHVFLIGRTLIPTHNSEALLAGALQNVDIPGYAGLLLRRTYADLTLPGALMDRAREWLGPFVDRKEVRWIEKEKTYLFQSGATVTFGYLESEKDKYRYQSAEFQYIGFDELTQFTETQYRYLFSRLRRLKGVNLPIRMRSATNPDGDGIQWVYDRFVIAGKERGRVFIPAKLEDNPALDQEEYEASLAELDHLTRMRLRHGIWVLDIANALFKRAWFEIVDNANTPGYVRKVRYWDFASTVPKKAPGGKQTDPDFSVGLLLGEHKGTFYIYDVIKKQVRPEQLEDIVEKAAIKDGPAVPIWIEEEPGSSGKIVIDHYTRNVLKNFTVRGNRETGAKVLRANPVSARAERNLIKLVRGAWNGEFLDEIELFPYGKHDDQVDALTGAYKMLRTQINANAIPTIIGERSSYWSMEA